MKKIVLPVLDYLKTRRKVVLKFIFPLILAIVYILLAKFVSSQQEIGTRQIFSDFITCQISMVAIFISFSIAIISILVSADNPNIQRLKETESIDGKIKKLNGNNLTLFQVLLSNLAYNVFIEVIYLALLIVYVLISNLLPECIIVYLIALGVFCIFHILQILLETVIQMYLTFWRK